MIADAAGPSHRASFVLGAGGESRLESCPETLHGRRFERFARAMKSPGELTDVVEKTQMTCLEWYASRVMSHPSTDLPSYSYGTAGTAGASYGKPPWPAIRVLVTYQSPHPCTSTPRFHLGFTTASSEL